MKFFSKYFLFFIFGTFTSFSQDYEVNYDLIGQKTNVINLKYPNDTLHKKEFKIKPGSTLKFNITNFNSEALEIETISKKSRVIDTLLMTANQSSIFSFLQNKMVAPSLGKEFTGLIEGFTKSRGQKVSPLKTNKLIINQDEVASIPYYDYNELSTMLTSRFNAFAKLQEVDSDLKKLRYDFTNTEEQIKANANKTIDYLDNDTKRIFKNAKNQMEVLERIKQIGNDNALVIELASEALEPAFKKDSSLKSRSLDNEFINKIKSKNYTTFQQTAKEFNAEKIEKELINLYQDYRTIQDKKYSYTFITTANYNTDLLNIIFYKSALVTNGKKKEILKTESFKFKLSELKISSTTGLVFVNFFDKPKSYGSYSGKVTATDLDRITPVLASMLNFGSTGSATVKIGGNLGVGIAINEKKSVNFFLGPSISIGKANLIHINLGLATSRLTRLGEGLKIGDSYTAKVPTVERYELGTYFGLTFNLTGLKK